MPLACLANTSLAALLAAKARPVGSAPQPLCLEHDQTVGEALAALNSRGVLSAPLLVFPTLDDGAADGGGDWDGGAPTYLGFLDVWDLLRAVLERLPPCRGLDASGWASVLRRDAPALLARQLVTVRSAGDAELVFAPEAGISVLAAVRGGFLGGASSSGRVCHRLAVFGERGDVRDVFSQSDAVRFVAQSPAALAALGDATLASLGLGRGGVAAVAAALPTVEALSFATSQGVSAVAVIGDSGVLVGSLSVSDLRACAGAGALASLALPVREFLAGQRLVTCAPDALLSAVVARLAAERVHRLWVVDSDGVPSGVVTLTDVLRVMCSE